MYRFALEYLENWTDKPNRKPLVIRGARQVGKSYLAGMLAEKHFDNLLEINLETDPESADLFASRDPSTIVRLLESRYGRPVVPGRTLLFLDEIQAAPELFASLRYFREQLPELHVVAAGSLLDFLLGEHDFSMPVGRIEYLHLGPMTFEEFLLAADRTALRDLLSSYSVGESIPRSIHEELMSLVRRFLLVGGMPAPVAAFLDSEDTSASTEELQSILSTYRDDFAKYAGRVDRRRLEKVFMTIPRLIGSKLIYSRIDENERSRDLDRALDLLCLARVAHRVRHTGAGGVPLGAECNDRVFKVLFMDVGLLSRAVGLRFADLETSGDPMLVNAGALCEQLIGQHLLHRGELYEDPALYCWMRQKPQSNAEVDYVISFGQTVVPVEVKAGKTGSLKSLHVFLKRKKRGFALRFNADLPSLLESETSIAGWERSPFRLLSLPLYLVGQAERLCRQCLAD